MRRPINFIGGIMHCNGLIIAAFLLVAAAGCACRSGGDRPADSHVTPGHAGQFDSDTVRVELLSDGRHAIMLQSLTFTDVRQVKWTAPEGEKSDGATIPKVFWSIVGGPWDGQYRFAALVHDHYCDVHEGRCWQHVHRMFYEASIAGGTDPLLAKILYAAVYHFGPRWDEESKGSEQLALLIPPEQKRIAEITEAKALQDLPATGPMGLAPVPRRIQQHERALLVLSPTPALRTFAAPHLSATVQKWDRIRDYLLKHQDASLDEINRIQ